MFHLPILIRSLLSPHCTAFSNGHYISKYGTTLGSLRSVPPVETGVTHHNPLVVSLPGCPSSLLFRYKLSVLLHVRTDAPSQNFLARSSRGPSSSKHTWLLCRIRIHRRKYSWPNNSLSSQHMCGPVSSRLHQLPCPNSQTDTKSAKSTARIMHPHIASLILTSI